MKKINFKNSKGEYDTLKLADVEFDEVTGESYSYFVYEDAKKKLLEKDYVQALRLFRKALRMEIHYKTFENIGICYMELNAPDKAIEPLLAATALNRQIGAPYRCAEAFVEIGRLGYADMMLEIVLSREPKHRKALKLMKQLRDKKKKEGWVGW